MIHSHKELTVWQRGVELCIEVYGLTEEFPREELYGLISQMRRSAVSIPANIAEGRSRSTRRDYLQFLRIAHGSASELETHLEIAKRLPKMKHLNYAKVSLLLLEVIKMLSVMIKNLNPNRS